MEQLIVVTMIGFAIGAALMALASLRAAAEVRKQRWLKLAGYFIIVHAVLGSAALGRPWLVALVIAVLAAGTWELRRALSLFPPGTRANLVRIWLTYAVFSVALLLAVASLVPEYTIFLYLVVASSDGFSQVVGQLFGRHPLSPVVSPNKTVEGLIGGIVGAFIVAWFSRGLVDLAFPSLLLLAFVIAACGIGGDLLASRIKRKAGIKEFSNLLHAQGGVLDTFDSFIGAGAVAGPALLALSGA